MSEVRVRVAVYVVRDTLTGPELLVFDHRDQPEAGTQVPAGGIEAGEPLEDAVLREVAEETGVTAVTVRTSLGVQQRPHPHTGQPRVTVFYHASTTERRDRWSHQVAGSSGTDDGMVFECFFIPVEKALDLLPDRQDEFVAALLQLLPENG
ncbi:NUDIX domain-containing protein [Verrucosispora sp. WMMD573]|uniref:NUDIX hydrolase n=1 Tax=Verrucosispora sp. WMMD573 TaxID=3015149 RepID=UPI00248BDC05|nr:NUDIX domain-containing protein [Verrucosispora sp. WMMD573]WBB53235.1 NUDIX domain-containing protein [Verrucosispora sp. WMMD573]